MYLDGIHHITAITGDARRNLDFYTRVLGLRLVAKSVNQDDPSVYHLFYADEQARAGSDITFFEYPRAKPGRPGEGMVHTIVWRVADEAALDFWAARLEGAERTEGSVRFSDPEGLRHELVIDASGDAPLAAEHPEVPAEFALRGFEGVRAYASDPERSASLLEQVLGATRTGDGDVWELRGEARGGWIAYDPPPSEPGRQSGGVVHHVAWGTSVAEHPRWERALAAAGVPSSGIIDRRYFHSIYFREPSGVLFEIADDGPGFTVDGTLEELGSKIILPPQFEPARERLEARLTPLPDPRADRAGRARA
jgi:glyoxalase family protein